MAHRTMDYFFSKNIVLSDTHVKRRENWVDGWRLICNRSEYFQMILLLMLFEAIGNH